MWKAHSYYRLFIELIICVDTCNFWLHCGLKCWTIYSQMRSLKIWSVQAVKNLWTKLSGLELTPKKDVLFIIGDWNAKVGSQEPPGVTGKFGLRIRNEAGQRLIEFCQENALVIPNTLFQQHKRRLYTWISPDGQHHQIDYILCSQDGEALYRQQKQDQELTVAQIMNSLMPNSDLNWRK